MKNVMQDIYAGAYQTEQEPETKQAPNPPHPPTPTLYDPDDENGISADMSDEGYSQGNSIYYHDDILKPGTGQEELAIDRMTKAFEQAGGSI